MSNNESTRLYRESGVDIEKADKLVDWLQEADASQTTKHGAEKRTCQNSVRKCFIEFHAS